VQAFKYPAHVVPKGALAEEQGPCAGAALVRDRCKGDSPLGAGKGDSPLRPLASLEAE